MTARPWELAQGTRPWEMPQGIFVRTVDIHRIASPADSGTDNVGDIGYVGAEPGPPGADTIGTTEGEVVLYTNVIAAIQATGGGQTKGPLPGDVVWMPRWRIYISGQYVPASGIRDRDILIDDDGYRYAVQAADWEPLGWLLHCIRLEV